MLFNEEKLNKNHLSEAEVILAFQCLSGREAKRQTLIMRFGKVMTDQNAMRFDAEVARVDDTMVSSGFLGAVKMYGLLLWPLVAVCQHLAAKN